MSVVGLACALAISSGCGESNKNQGRRPLPKLAEVAPQNPVHASAAVAPLSEVKHRRIISQKLVYPREDGRVDVALSTLDAPEGLSKDVRAIWKANGLHIAELTRDDLKLFKTNLPRTISLETLELLPGAHYGPIDLISRIPARQETRYVDRQGNAQVHRFLGGRYRFLAKMVGSIDGDAQLRLDLLPHHYGPRGSLLVRPIDQKVLDGTTFDELRLLHPMPTDRAWLIWSDPLPTPEPDPTKPNAPRAIQAPLLGQAMMCGELHGKPVRMVLVITSR